MKAIQTICKGPTMYRPRRVLAKAEGVPTFAAVDSSVTIEELHKIAAYGLAYRQGWLTGSFPGLIGGTLPDGSHCWVFAPEKQED